MKKIFKTAAACLLSLAPLSAVKAQEKKPSAEFNAAAYYAFAYQEGSFIAGYAAGPVYGITTKAVNAEFDLFLNYTVTGENSPVDIAPQLMAGVWLGVTNRENSFYTVPSVTFYPNLDGKMSFLNSFYVDVSLPLSANMNVTTPAVTVGYYIALKANPKKPKTARNVQFEMQRFPSL